MLGVSASVLDVWRQDRTLRPITKSGGEEYEVVQRGNIMALGRNIIICGRKGKRKQYYLPYNTKVVGKNIKF